MINFTTKLHALTLTLAMALTSTPMQITIAATGLSLMASGQAMAQNNIPGIGVIIKKNPGSGAIGKGISDEEGMLEFSGLEPGEYSVCFADDKGEGGSCVDAKVGEEGVIRGQTVFDEKLKSRKRNYYVGHVTLLR